MKGKKVSAFSVFHKSQSQPNLKERNNANTNNSEAKMKKRKNSNSPESSFTKRRKENQNGSAAHNNLDKSSAIVEKNVQNIKERCAKTTEKIVIKKLNKSPGSEKKKGKLQNRNITEIKPLKKEENAEELDSDAEVESQEKLTIPNKNLSDSRVDAEKCFEWLIHPVKPEKFFKELWEKKPMLLKRHHPSYYKGIFSCKDLDSILREKTLHYGKNIDITSYQNNKRETHNPAGRAYPAVVWDFYQSGCSVRLLNPQTFSKSVWKLNSILQEYFGTFVGANVYLTPPGTQGFAPHYDDIEAFVLQLEGRKRWKLYNPRSPAETLPRYSSGNFTSDEVGEPILNIELEPGDLLYFPRGIIHQASTSDDIHSLHITISACQRNTWGDFLEKLLPRALQLAFEEDLEFRECLPRNYLEFVGVAHCDKEQPERTDFFQKLQYLLSKLSSYAPVDACVDQMVKDYIHDCLPPVLSRAEKACSIHGSGEHWQDDKVVDTVELEPDTAIRLIRANILRLVTEDNTVRIYYSVDNSREYHAEEPQFIEIAPEVALAVEVLIHTYPDYLEIEKLPLENLTDKISLATVLYDKGLVITEGPLEIVDHV